jgi:hypothetical protein
MTVDGREDLYNYTYLTANGYLNKFRNALGLPNLQRPLLIALLKTFNDRRKLHGFITKNRQGKDCLFYKRTLNQILGMTDDGHTYTEPERNVYIQELHRYLDEWDMKEFDREEERKKMYEPSDYSSDEEDMQKMSDALANLEENSEKKMKGKKITITESQFNELKKKINENYFVETEKVKAVVKYLDDNFLRGSMPAIGEDGYPKAIGIVGMKFKDGTIAKNMTATQLFYLLQDKFNKIYEDPKQRDALLKKIVVDWYYRKISKSGLLSRNNY